MVLDNPGIGENISQGLQALLLRQDGVKFSPREGVVQHVEEAVPLREVVVHQINQIIRFADRFNHFPTRQNYLFITTQH